MLTLSCLRKNLSQSSYFLILASCASRYQGGAPDFSKRGSQQIQEVRKFEINEGFMAQGLSYLMGPQQTRYTLASIDLLFQDISPEAYKASQRGQIIYNVSMVGAAATAIMAAMIITQKGRIPASAWILGGTSFALASTGGIALHLYNQEAARRFNKDIHKKFVPALGYHQNF